MLYFIVPIIPRLPNTGPFAVKKSRISFLLLRFFSNSMLIIGKHLPRRGARRVKIAAQPQAATPRYRSGKVQDRNKIFQKLTIS